MDKIIELSGGDLGEVELAMMDFMSTGELWIAYKNAKERWEK